MPEFYSKNKHLEEIYAGAPDYLVNRELTLPCAVEPDFEDDAVKKDPDLKKRLDDLMRIIIPPTLVDKLSGDVRDDIRVLASPYECGRVLEDDEPVLIDGIPHIITIKGPGATTFVANEGAKSRFFPSDLSGGLGDKAFRAEQARKRLEELRDYRFRWLDGVMGIHDARVEKERSQLMAMAGFDVERVLAIYRITAMPNHAGEMLPISYFQDERIVNNHPMYSPSILVRAVKSNFRLLDLINLLKLDDPVLMKRFIEYAVKLFAQIEGKKDATPKDYFFWLAERSIDQSTNRFFAGYPNRSAEWPTLSRNRSTMAEGIDLEGGDIAGPYRAHFNDEGHFIDLCEGLDFLRTSLVFYAVAINRAYPGCIDLKDLAAMYESKVQAVFNNNHLKDHHGRFKNSVRKFDQFVAAVHNQLLKNASAGISVS